MNQIKNVVLTYKKKGVSKLAILLIIPWIFGCNTNFEQENSATAEKPNIIVMYSDDHGAQSIGAYRGALNYGFELDHTPTPHIDRLAERGMRFDNAFVTNSICKPSRAVLLTGVHSHQNGVKTNDDSLSINLETFPLLLQKHGYQTAIIGKWHLKTVPQGFDYYEVLYGQGPYYNPTMRTTNGDVDRHGHTTEVITESALQWLKLDRKTDEPFMLIYNQKAPHRAWWPGPKHLDDYRNRDLPEPSTLFYDYSGLTMAASEQDMEIGSTMTWGRDLKFPINPETGEINEDYYRLINETNRMTEDQIKRFEDAYAEENEYIYQNYDQMSEEERVRWKYQRYIKDYLRVVRGVDDGVGELMAYLERENLIDNTIVIYASDQGFFLGENGWFDKRFIYEPSLRMPLIIHWPEGVKPGSVNKQLVQNLDLAPTVLDLAGLEIPEQMQGKSLLPLLKGEQYDDWRNAVYYHFYEGPPRVHQVARHYGVRTERYTLAHFYDHDEWELFDLQDDPEQLLSVYKDQEYAEVRKRLKEILTDLQIKYDDKNAYE